MSNEKKDKIKELEMVIAAKDERIKKLEIAIIRLKFPAECFNKHDKDIDVEEFIWMHKMSDLGGE